MSFFVFRYFSCSLLSGKLQLVSQLPHRLKWQLRPECTFASLSAHADSCKLYAICGKSNTGSCQAIRRVPGYLAMFWVVRFIIYLTHAPSFGDSVVSYILNMPLIWRFRFRLITYLQHAPPIWRCLFFIYLQQVGDRFNMYLEWAPSFGVSGSACIFKHASSFGDSGSSYILNMPPHFAIPIRPRSTKHPLFWRFRFIMYLKPSPLSRFRFIIYLQHAPSFGDSGSSYLVNTPLIWRWRFRFITYLQHAPRPPSGGSVNMPPHLAIPHHHTSYTRPLLWRF